MKMIIVLAALVAIAVAAPQGGPDKDAVILKYDADNIGVDGYQFLYETSNRISQQESGQLANAGTDNEIMRVTGQFSFVGLDGVTYTVKYIADENGFQPIGDHIPHA